MSIVVVGSVAYDTVETTTGGANDALGGSAGTSRFRWNDLTPPHQSSHS
jgi:hypothetical protein